MDEAGKRFKKWLKDNIKEFDTQDFAHRFYDEFRNGLVHEGRIKNGGQFSYELKELVRVIDSIMIVNPEKLLEKIEKSFEKYIGTVEKEEWAFQALKCALIRDFQRDIEHANR